VRVPSDLHRKAVEKAKKMGLSLNQFVQKALEDEVAV
jgi:predicted HicB family RNase H-like nuclease